MEIWNTSTHRTDNANEWDGYGVLPYRYKYTQLNHTIHITWCSDVCSLSTITVLIEAVDTGFLN